MSIYFIKLSSAIVIFFAALAGGLIPTLSRYQNLPQSALTYSNFFARGIFLGVGLIHLLPEAVNESHHVWSNYNYLMVLGICIVTMISLRSIEKAAIQFYPKYQRNDDEVTWVSYIVVIFLSIHSLAEGTALGINSELGGIIAILLAILAHKSASALALTINMQNRGLSTPTCIKLLVIFSIMAPLGILFGSSLNAFLQGNTNQATSVILTSIAAGTFIYIAAFDAHKEPTIATQTSMGKFFCFSLGIFTTALIAFCL